MYRGCGAVFRCFLFQLDNDFLRSVGIIGNRNGRNLLTEVCNIVLLIEIGGRSCRYNGFVGEDVVNVFPLGIGGSSVVEIQCRIAAFVEGFFKLLIKRRCNNLKNRLDILAV